MVAGDSTHRMGDIEGAAVEAQHVAFSYGRVKVLEALSLTVSPGMIFGLLGANGSGKTTLIRILVGLLKLQSGTVR